VIWVVEDHWRRQGWFKRFAYETWAVGGDDVASSGGVTSISHTRIVAMGVVEASGERFVGGTTGGGVVAARHHFKRIGHEWVGVHRGWLSFSQRGRRFGSRCARRAQAKGGP